MRQSARTGYLFRELFNRELGARFVGSSLGPTWIFLGPLAMLGIYSLVFGQFFKMRVGGDLSSSYTLFVASALWPWMMFADGVLRGTSAIVSNGTLVKKTLFPHWLLVAASVSATFVLHLAGYSLVLAVLAATGATIQWTGLPIVAGFLALLFALSLGAAMLCAALQVLLRDVEMAVAPLLTMLHFLTPVIYPLSLIPENYRAIIETSPLSTIVSGIRHALLGGAGSFTAGQLIGLLLACALTLWLGAIIFQRLSAHFEDFL
jgi:lipopolysaccharide transport system permease protein